MEESERMNEDLTPQEVLDLITASGYDGYWSMAVEGRRAEGVVTIFISPDSEEQLAAALEVVPDGIEVYRYTAGDGREFATLYPWTICYPREAQP